MPEGFLPPHGGYRKLLSYQRAEIVFDATISFCARFLNRRDRTVDQMIQAARSGKQNIIEGSEASGMSKEMEIKLTSVARASFEELLADYRDFLRVRKHPEWPKDHAYARRLAKLVRTPDANYDTFRRGIENADPVIAANVIIGLIKVTNYLLDQQIRALEQAFVKEGGIRERMTKARLRERARTRRAISMPANTRDFDSRARPWFRRGSSIDTGVEQGQWGLSEITVHLTNNLTYA